MDLQLIVICLLTAGINLIGTLAYAARIAGVRTRRIAMSFALFNILVLVSRTSNSFLGPFLAKRIETRLHEGGGDALAGDFRIVLASATLAVFVGILLVPTGQRMFASAIGHFQRNRSTARMILRSATPAVERLRWKWPIALGHFQRNRSTARMILRSATPAVERLRWK